MNRLIPSAFAALCSLPGSAQVATISWEAPVACNATGQGALRPRIAVNGNGDPVVIWGDNSPMANHVSVGNGSIFSAPVQVSQGFMPSVDDWMGSSIAAWGNTIWVVMKAMPEESEPLYVSRSDDGGFTWGDTIRVEPFDGLVSRFPSIDLAGPDAPLVQYMQFDNGFAGARQVVCHMMGSSFMPPVQVSTPFAPGDVCDCCPNQIVSDGQRAVALYRNAGPNIRVMWGASSVNGGMTFPVGAEIDTTGWALSACPSSGPDGYIAGDSVRYVWMSGANNGTKAYVGSALISDLSLGKQRKVQGGVPFTLQQNFPRIAGSGDTLGIVWQQNSGSSQEILFSWSVTGLNGLSAPDTVNTTLAGAQQTPDIEYADGAFHIVWSEPGTGQVRYRRAVLSTVSSILENRPGMLRAWPNPTVNRAQLGDGPWTNATIIDARGRFVDVRQVYQGWLDLAGLAAGSYTVRLSGLDGRTGTTQIEKAE